MPDQSNDNTTVAPAAPKPNGLQVSAAEALIEGFIKDYGNTASDTIRRSLAFGVHALMTGNPAGVPQHLTSYLQAFRPDELMSTVGGAARRAENDILHVIMNDVVWDNDDEVLTIGLNAADHLGIPPGDFVVRATAEAAVAEAAAGYALDANEKTAAPNDSGTEASPGPASPSSGEKTPNTGDSGTN